MKVFEGINIEAFELIVSEACNYRCKYCFDSHYSAADCGSVSPNLDVSLIPDIITFIQNTNKSGNVSITYFGGEPLMNWSFIETFTPTIKDLYPDVRFNIVTNGSLLTPDRSHFLLENKITIVFSIDGKMESHDKWRISKNGGSTWRKTIVPAMRTLAFKPDAEIIINMVMNNDTVSELFENYSFFIKLGFHNITLLINADIEWSEENLNTLKKQIHLITDNKLPLNPNVIRDVDMCHFKNQLPNYCFNPYRNVTISSTGDLFFCHRFVPKLIDKSKFDHSYGNVRDGYINRKYFNEVSERIHFEEVKSKISCEGCEIKYRCAGGCIAAHTFKTNDLYKKNKTFCDVMRVMINSFKEELKEFST